MEKVYVKGDKVTGFSRPDVIESLLRPNPNEIKAPVKSDTPIEHNPDRLSFDYVENGEKKTAVFKD